MEKDINILWQTVLAKIETDVSRANFLTLFKPTVLISLEENIATIAAPSNMIIDLLQRRFYEIIKNAIDKETEKSIKLIFVPKTLLPIKKEEKGYPLFAQAEKSNGKTIGHLPRVRTEYTFENMAVSSSNQLAYVSATAVAKKIGHLYNPLFIYGPVGCGKTHLMQAIANDVYAKSPDKKIVYLTSEEFTNEVVEAIRTNTTSSMKRRFRNLDLLIIDDVQFVAGKEKIQEELFHTFNILVDKGSQIILSSDRPPTEMRKVEKRLLSRFSGGLTVDIEPPDFELRTAILLIKAKKHGFDLSIETAKMIAQKAMDGRSLEGLLLRIVTEAAARGEDPTYENTQILLEKKGSDHINNFHPDELIKAICSFYKIKTTQIKGSKREARLVRARQVAMYILKKELCLTFVEIGNILGGRDHTTVMHGVDKIEKMLTKTKISEDIMGITRLTREKIVDY